jgi:hypothetical protein
MGKFTDDEFREFCVAECARFGAFRFYRFLATAVKLEYCNWMYRKAQGDEQKVKRLIDELINEYDTLPTIHELGNIWLRLFPAVHEWPAVACEVCNGTGYRIIEIHNVSGAERCPRRCPVSDGGFQPAPVKRRLPSAGAAPSDGQPHSTDGRLRPPTAEAISGTRFE